MTLNTKVQIASYPGVKRKFTFFFVVAICLISGNLKAQELQLHPVPNQLLYSAQNHDYTVQVRQEGGEWQDLFEYKVEVDLDTKSWATMVQFDFEGKVELKIRVNNGGIQKAIVRPLRQNIQPEIKGHTIYLSLDKPSKLSLEINDNRLNNLHIFANAIDRNIPNESDTNVIYFGPGVHKPEDQPGNKFSIASNKTVYLAPGAVVQGKFVCDRVENVKFTGRGIILNPERGFEITHSKNIEIDGLTVINPAHYTVYGGETKGLKINNLKSFSSRGWSDGIDLMSCSDVTINDIFMRNSDDCIAIYTHRWNFYGDAKNYQITNAILWADVAHPINIGLHGDDEKGSVIENIHFKNIDILEHDEDDRNYQGAMAFSVSDLNLVQDVSFENVHIENIQEGQLFNLRVLYNEKYSKAPGRGIKNILFKDIYYYDSGENPSLMEGYSDANAIENVRFENIVIKGKKVQSLQDANIKLGKFTKNVTLLNQP